MDFNQIREQLLGADLNKGLQVRVGLEVSVKGCGKLAAFETQQQRHTALLCLRASGAGTSVAGQCHG